MPKTSVGIVTRTRDRPLFVVRALRAVLAQTHPDWRLVLVNDGGDAAALQAALAEGGLAARFAEGALRIVDNPDSHGRAAAFNQGLAALDTDFVACLDDDDTWHPDFLAALVAFHGANAPLVPDLGGVAARVTALREDVATDPDGRARIVPLGEDGLPNAFHRNDFLIGPLAYGAYRQDLYPVQWILERDAVAAVGGFPEDFEVMEDRAFLMRFLQHHRIALLDQPLAFHHRRIRRANDTGKSAELNTLDNPSYDWRRFADLAQPSLATPATGPEAVLAGLIRAVGTSVVKEINDETSALWHKINGEAKGLRERIEALEARLAGGAPPPPAIDPAGALWSLWAAVGTQDIGYPLGVGHPFLGRLTVSCAGPDDGLLFHAAPDRREAVLQVPTTGAWCALELDLTGLAPPGRGLRLDVAAGLAGGGLFQTALVRKAPGGRGHAVTDTHVHVASDGATTHLTRYLPPAALDPKGAPRLSIVLPRQASNLRLYLHDLVANPG
jgi:glycosyltransferase involved in cell wall biosynthesis